MSVLWRGLGQICRGFELCTDVPSVVRTIISVIVLLHLLVNCYKWLLNCYDTYLPNKTLVTKFSSSCIIPNTSLSMLLYLLFLHWMVSWWWMELLSVYHSLVSHHGSSPCNLVHVVIPLPMLFGMHLFLCIVAHFLIECHACMFFHECSGCIKWAWCVQSISILFAYVLVCMVVQMLLLLMLNIFEVDKYS